jgi:4'-phosphopantetheinyl transferase
MAAQDLEEGCRAPPGWRVPGNLPALKRRNVHVWRIALDLAEEQVASLASLLSSEERARAARFLPADAGRRFVVSHGAVRMILGGYLGQKPERIVFATDEQGKPHIARWARDPALSFNLSHSGELALCAVAEGRAVGVDVERMHPVAYWRDIAERYYSVRENEALRGLPDDLAFEAFFHVWTRKEACAKALGQGMSQQWARLEVPVAPAATRAVVNVMPEDGQDRRLMLSPLAPGPGYVGAVAATGEGGCLACWQWRIGESTA